MHTLHTDRHLRLREVQLSDALEIFASVQEQRVHLGRWLPFVAKTRCLNDTVVYLQGVARAIPRRPVFTIRVGRVQTFAGLAGFRAGDSESGTVQIGCWLREEYQGRGIASRAVKRLCRYAFRKLDARRVEIKCATRNVRGNRLAQRLGFRLCRVEYRAQLLSDGHRTNLKVYALERRPALRQWLRHPLRTWRARRPRTQEPVPTLSLRALRTHEEHGSAAPPPGPSGFAPTLRQP